MAYDAFLKLDGVTGESQKQDHAGEIDLTSFAWAASNSSSVGTGTGVSGGGWEWVARPRRHPCCNPLRLRATQATHPLHR